MTPLLERELRFSPGELLLSSKQRYALPSLGAPIPAEMNPSNLIRFGPA